LHILPLQNRNSAQKQVLQRQRYREFRIRVFISRDSRFSNLISFIPLIDRPKHRQSSCKMSRLVTISVALALCVVLVSAGSLHREKRQLIPREFANINIEQYLKNPRAVRFQLNCLLYDGHCDRIGKYIKLTIPELITNRCRNCSPEQKAQAGKLVACIQQNYAKEWDDAIKKFQGGQKVTQTDLTELEDEFKINISSKTLVVDAGNGTAVTTTASPNVSTSSISPKEIGDLVRGTIAEIQSNPELRKKAEADFKELEARLKAKQAEERAAAAAQG